MLCMNPDMAPFPDIGAAWTARVLGVVIHQGGAHLPVLASVREKKNNGCWQAFRCPWCGCVHRHPALQPGPHRAACRRIINRPVAGYYLQQQPPERVHLAGWLGKSFHLHPQSGEASWKPEQLGLVALASPGVWLRPEQQEASHFTAQSQLLAKPQPYTEGGLSDSGHTYCAHVLDWEVSCGKAFPVVAALREPAGPNVVFRCPWCGRLHGHGAVDGHTVAHLCIPTARHPQGGYFTRQVPPKQAYKAGRLPDRLLPSPALAAASGPGQGNTTPGAPGRNGPRAVRKRTSLASRRR